MATPKLLEVVVKVAEYTVGNKIAVFVCFDAGIVDHVDGFEWFVGRQFGHVDS